MLKSLRKKHVFCAYAALLLAVVFLGMNPPPLYSQTPSAFEATSPPSEDNSDSKQGESEKNMPRVSNFFIETDLRMALQDLSAEAGVNIIADPEVRGVVSVELEDTPLDEALKLILAGTGYHFIRTDKYYLVFPVDQAADSFLEVSDTQLVALNHIRAKTAVDMLPRRLQDFVKADEEIDVVAITAAPKMIERIVRDLKVLDQPRKHVLLDARIVVLDRRATLDLGVGWSFPEVTAGAYTSFMQHDTGADTMWPWGVQIGYTPNREFTNALNLTLNLMTQNEEATIVASPQLLAQDGQQANIKVTTEEYFNITTQADTFVRGRLETIETGTILDIIPRIGGNGEITLDMEIEVSDVVARGDDNLPVVNRRTARSAVQVQSGGTAAIAGLLDTRTDEARQAVPGFSRIPLFGRLFRSSKTRSKDSQIAIFITATLLEQEDEQFRAGRQWDATIRSVDEDWFRRRLDGLLH